MSADENVRQAGLVRDGERVREAGTTEIRLDDRDLLTGLAIRQCEVANRRRLPLAGDGARHQDGLERLVQGKEVEMRPKRSERLDHLMGDGDTAVDERRGLLDVRHGGDQLGAV